MTVGFCFSQWYAVCLSDVGDYEGVKVKIGNSYIIKEHLEVGMSVYSICILRDEHKKVNKLLRST